MKPHRLIVASAGSGKTHQLTRHFIEIVADGVGRDDGGVVERILAATFTRAAAGEIAQRILFRLAKAAVDAEERRRLCEELGNGEMSDEDCIKLLKTLVRRLNRLRICTLDSFLVRSAQCFAPELGLAFPWTILDDQADRLLRLEAIDALLADAARSREHFDAMLSLLIQLNQSRFPLQVRERLAEHFAQTYELLQAGPASAWEAIRPDEKKILSDAALADLIAKLPARIDPHLPRTQRGAPAAHWSRAVDHIRACASVGDWESLAEVTLVGRILAGEAEFARFPITDGIITTLRPLIDHAGASLLAILRDRNLSTRDLLLKFDQHYRLAKARRSAYRFDDFTSLLIDAGIVRPDVLSDFYYRLDGRIDHILLDEFQDTSIGQWKLMEPLVDEVLAGEGAARGDGGSRSFFCVGDIKQTLYGWRNAEPKLLKELTKRWSQLDPEPLVESRRSAPVIIDTINRVFGDLPANPALPAGDEHLRAAADEWHGWFTEHSTVHKDLNGFVRLLTCEDGATPTEKTHNAIRFAAERAAALHHAMPGREIAILLRRKRFINQIIFALTHRHYVECSGEGGSPLIDDPVVCTALSMLQLIEHPSDSAARYHVGTSPLGAALGLSEDADRSAVLRLTGSIRRELMDRGLPAVLNSWLARCAADCGPRNMRRFKQLIELAAQYPYDGGDLGTFVQYVREKRVEDVTSARIRVMTIHASKGRQFDAVILPDLDGDLVPTHASVLIERDELLEPATCITTSPSKAVRQFEPRLVEMEMAWKTRQAVEELCALYVAMTRAKQGLELIIHPRREPKSGVATLPKSAAGVICGALLGIAPTESKKEIWSHESSAIPSPPPLKDEAPATPQPLQVRIARPDGMSRIRPEVSPSSLEGGGYIDLKGALDFASDRSRDRGSVVHRCFQQVLWLDDMPPTDDALRSALGDAVGAAELPKVLSEFRAACRKRNVAATLSRSSYQSRNGDTLDIWRERPFIVRDTSDARAGDVMLRGQFDRVILTRRDGKVLSAELIDFKSDRIGKDRARVRKLTEHYAPQIHAYRRALSILTGLDQSAISSKLLFIDADELVEVPAK